MKHRLDVCLTSDNRLMMEELRRALRDCLFIQQPITVSVRQPHETDQQTFVVDVEDVSS